MTHRTMYVVDSHYPVARKHRIEYADLNCPDSGAGGFSVVFFWCVGICRLFIWFGICRTLCFMLGLSSCVYMFVGR